MSKVGAQATRPAVWTGSVVWFEPSKMLDSANGSEWGLTLAIGNPHIGSAH
ncbi:MAG: hypothetical protein HOP18_24830 [Deltaproteobacteria bacterium]|nr:hypothetical protein [Deltaproteobacteria bacterium]